MSKQPQDSESRHADKYIVRLPEGMRAQIKAAADANGRSMNAEIVFRLQVSLASDALVTEDDAEMSKGEIATALALKVLEVFGKSSDNANITHYKKSATVSHDIKSKAELNYYKEDFTSISNAVHEPGAKYSNQAEETAKDRLPPAIASNERKIGRVSKMKRHPPESKEK